MPLGGKRPRALPAALLLHRNEPVTTEQLVEMMWPDVRPEQPAKTVHVHVSRLRRALDEESGESVLETRDGAYVLRVGPDELDADRFTALVADGRRALAAGDGAGAARTLSDALALWRGAPLVDFAYEAFAQAEIGHLEELRLSAQEALIDAELALGRHAAVIPRLERLADEQPLREHIHAQLMLALYRCGRQADALATYRRLRHTLDGQLGLEPSPTVRRLEQQILQQDPDLDGAQAAMDAPAATAGRVPLPGPIVHARAGPLVGRAAEIERIASLAGTLAGSRHVVLVSGDAGVGKTRLLAEIAAQLHADGWPVLYGRAEEDGLVPYQPFVEASAITSPTGRGWISRPRRGSPRLPSLSPSFSPSWNRCSPTSRRRPGRTRRRPATGCTSRSPVCCRASPGASASPSCWTTCTGRTAPPCGSSTSSSAAAAARS